jgi:hypothetical protein
MWPEEILYSRSSYILLLCNAFAGMCGVVTVGGGEGGFSAEMRFCAVSLRIPTRADPTAQ